MAPPIPSPTRDDPARPASPTESVRLGIGLTGILVAAYFGFIGLSAFAPARLAAPVVAGGTVTWAFAYGLAVIGLGVGLTGLYVLLANRSESAGRAR